MYIVARFCFAFTYACTSTLFFACNGTEAPKPEMAAPLTASGTPQSKVATEKPVSPKTAPELSLQVVR